MPDVHRTGRVGRHELHDDPLRCGGPRTSEALTRGKYGGEGGSVPSIGQEQVEKTGSGDLETLELLPEALGQSLAKALGQLTRWGASGGRE